jgi:hypothetical protein
MVSMGYDSFNCCTISKLDKCPEDTTSVNIDGGFDKEGNK